MTLSARNAAGTLLLLKQAPTGTPMFAVEARASGTPGACSQCAITTAEMAHPLNPSGRGAEAVRMHLVGYHNTST